MNGQNELLHIGELFTLSHNFKEPIGILINDRTITGVVEELDDKRVKLAGEWYSSKDIVGVVS